MKTLKSISKFNSRFSNFNIDKDFFNIGVPSRPPYLPNMFEDYLKKLFLNN